MTPYQVATTYPFSGALGAAADFRSSVIGALSLFVAPARAAELYDQGVTQLRKEAGDGAAKKVRPLVIASLAAGALGVVLGGVAIFTSRKRHS